MPSRERFRRVEAKTAPDPLPAVGCLMAVQAKSRNMTLVTSITRDFKRTAIKLLNPFQSH